MDLLRGTKGQALAGWGSKVPMETSLPHLTRVHYLNPWAVILSANSRRCSMEGSVNYVTAGLG